MQECRVEDKDLFIDFLGKKLLAFTSLSKRSSLLELFAFAFWFGKGRKTEISSPQKFLQFKFWLSLFSPKVLSYTDGEAKSKGWCCHIEHGIFTGRIWPSEKHTDIYTVVFYRQTWGTVRMTCNFLKLKIHFLQVLIKKISVICNAIVVTTPLSFKLRRKREIGFPFCRLILQSAAESKY